MPQCPIDGDATDHMPILAENLSENFSEVPTYSIRTLLGVFEAVAAGAGDLIFTMTYLSNDGVKSIINVVTKCGRRLEERTVPLTG